MTITGYCCISAPAGGAPGHRGPHRRQPPLRAAAGRHGHRPRPHPGDPHLFRPRPLRHGQDRLLQGPGAQPSTSSSSHTKPPTSSSTSTAKAPTSSSTSTETSKPTPTAGKPTATETSKPTAPTAGKPTAISRTNIVNTTANIVLYILRYMTPEAIHISLSTNLQGIPYILQ